MFVFDKSRFGYVKYAVHIAESVEFIFLGLRIRKYFPLQNIGRPRNFHCFGKSHCKHITLIITAHYFFLRVQRHGNDKVDCFKIFDCREFITVGTPDFDAEFFFAVIFELVDEFSDVTAFFVVIVGQTVLQRYASEKSLGEGVDFLFMKISAREGKATLQTGVFVAVGEFFLAAVADLRIENIE